MQLKKRLLCTHISLIVSAGLLTLNSAQPVAAQTSQLVCRANDAGDGWICESTGTAIPLRTAAQTDLVRETEPAITGSSAAVTIPVPERQATDLDWVDRSQLTPEELAVLPPSCCGAFIDPLSNLDLSSADQSDGTLLEAEIGLTQTLDGSITIEGPVQVQQGSRFITNDGSTVMDQPNNSVLMQGNVVFREPGVMLRGTNAYLDQNEDSNRVGEASYVLHNYGTHGVADSIVYNSASGQVIIENGEFSRCEPESNFWLLQARTIVIDQSINRGYARGTRLEIGGVPVFYYPFTFEFPLGDERISGFLAPSTGSTDDGGFDFALPYYLNLAPHYDATITPRSISDRGLMTSIEARYLAPWSMNTLNMSYLGNDKFFELGSNGLPLPDSPSAEKRWFIGYEHYGALGGNWSTYVDYNAVSDGDYFRDLGSAGLNVSSRTHLNRQGRLDFNSRYVKAGLNLQRIQVIDPFVDPAFAATDLNRPFDRVPQLSLSTTLPLPLALQFDLYGELTGFDRQMQESLLTPAQIEAGALVTGNRVNLEPTLTLALESPGWFLRPSAGIRYVGYQLENQALGSDEKPEVNIGVYSLDTGLVFERSMSFGGNGFTQTLEPRLYYLNSDYEDQSRLPLFDASEFSFSFNQLFRNDRFSGGDRVGDADQLSVALTSRFLDRDGRERARISLGQIQYFEDRLVSLDNPMQAWIPRYSPLDTSSAIAAEVSYALSDSWRLNLDLQWDEQAQEVDEGTFQFRHQSESGRIFNVSYRYRDIVTLPGFLLGPDVDPRIKQTDVSGALPVNSNWRFLGRWNYDHSNSRNLESFVGVEYSNCCATIRLVGREWVHDDDLFLADARPERGIFFQFTLHGLGNVTGGGVSGLLSDGIFGFRDPYQR
ncbi:MAG: LPS-assembly protein LptD [Pseudohongiellaceae bacterium]